MTKKAWFIVGAMALILVTVGYFHYRPTAQPPVQIVEQPAPAAPVELVEVVMPTPVIAVTATNDANLVKTRISGMRFAAAAVPVARPVQNSQ